MNGTSTNEQREGAAVAAELLALEKKIHRAQERGEAHLLATLNESYARIAGEWNERGSATRLPNALPFASTGAKVSLVETFSHLGELASTVSRAVSLLSQRDSPLARRTTAALSAQTTSVDIAIICALRAPELQAVLRTGTGQWSTHPQLDGDPSDYRAGQWLTTSGDTLSVIAAAPSQMGMPASAVLATKMIMTFRPRLVAMIGIAAGAKASSQGYGDILAPNVFFDYGSGRLEEDDGGLILAPDPTPINTLPIIVSRLKDWESHPERLATMRADWSAAPPPTALSLHVGPLGSGAAVVAATSRVEEVKEHWRKLIGLEMEAYGVGLACQETLMPPVPYLCMKAVCDFADAAKADNWQHYAAYTAARTAEFFISQEWDRIIR